MYRESEVRLEEEYLLTTHPPTTLIFMRHTTQEYEVCALRKRES